MCLVLGGVPGPGGVCVPGPGGVPGPRGGVPGPRGVYLVPEGVYLVLGGVPGPRGVPGWSGWCTWSGTPPPRGQNHRRL